MANECQCPLCIENRRFIKNIAELTEEEQRFMRGMLDRLINFEADAEWERCRKHEAFAAFY